MRDRIKTLLLYSNAPARAESEINRWAAMKSCLRASERRVRQIRNRLFRRNKSTVAHHYDALSYVVDWKDAFCKSDDLEVTLCDVNNTAQFWRMRRDIRSFPLVVILHSVTGDDMSLLRKTESWFQNRRGALVVFIGNEYDLMDDKISFLQNSGAEFVGSQLVLESAKWLYAEAPNTQVLAMPHALNPMLYAARHKTKREIDIGFRGASYRHFVGDRERQTIIDYFRNDGERYGLKTDIQLNSHMPRGEWAAFLGNCRGIAGAEAGTYYLDRRGALITSVKQFEAENPGVGFDEIFDRFFRSPPTDYVSGKCISSRHFEPIGNKSCQVLLEGSYNGILRADQHYIAVKKDLSNIEDAILRFKDESLRRRMVEETYEYILDQHTYDHRVKSLVQEIAA